MGVRMKLVEQEFTIRQEYKQEALQDLKKFMEESDHTPRDKSFSWLNGVDHTEWNTLEEALQDWRFKPVTDEEGNITELQFIGQKIGDEDQMFEVIKQYVDEESYLQFSYDTGNTETYTFRNGQVENTGVWKLQVEGIELSDADRQHIAQQIKEGYTQGEVIQ